MPQRLVYKRTTIQAQCLEELKEKEPMTSEKKKNSWKDCLVVGLWVIYLSANETEDSWTQTHNTVE